MSNLEQAHGPRYNRGGKWLRAEQQMGQRTKFSSQGKNKAFNSGELEK